MRIAPKYRSFEMKDLLHTQVGQTCSAVAGTGPAAGSSVTAGGGLNPMEPFIRAVQSTDIGFNKNIFIFC